MKTSYLFLILLSVIAVTAAYEALFPLPPVIIFTRFFALTGFFLVCVALSIGPLATLWPQTFSQNIKARRAIGVSSFVFVFMHLILVLAVTYNWQLGILLATPSLILSTIATIIFLAMTVTSNDFSIRTLGGINWKNLQRLAYLAFVLSFVHFLLQATGLFAVTQNKMVFANLAELFAVALGLAVIILQVVGYFTKKKMQKAAAPATNT